MEQRIDEGGLPTRDMAKVEINWKGGKGCKEAEVRDVLTNLGGAGNGSGERRCEGKRAG